MSRTYLEISFDDRLLSDLEEIAEDAGADIPTLINILCAIYISSNRKENLS